MPEVCLDEEQCAQVRDCLRKANVALPTEIFERLVREIEDSISRFRGSEPSGGFRNAHDALRAIWLLAHEDDPPLGVLRTQIKALPRSAVKYIDRRFPRAIPRLFPRTPFEDGTTFLAWTEKASGDQFVRALQVLSAEGAQIVAGRSRGRGKRSASRVEPVILGETRGAGAKKEKGGRPSEDARHELVGNLGLDWSRATERMPDPGRSSETAFGDLVHGVFQWLEVSEDPYEAATYALRRHWEQVEFERNRPSLDDFLRRHGEEI
ncbi:MAG: hypothetical protein WA459_04675 [Stellaceae bacterium]